MRENWETTQDSNSTQEEEITRRDEVDDGLSREAKIKLKTGVMRQSAKIEEESHER